MRTTTVSTLLAAALLLPGTPVHAQRTDIDSRWIAYVGCWESMGLKQSTICILPVGEAAVDLVTIDSGAVTAAERIVAGERVTTTQGECSGWQVADWSTVSDRLYLQSEETCPRGATRTGNGLLALARDGALLYIQGGTVGVKTGVEVQRYRTAQADIDLPSEVRDALDHLGFDMTAKARARAAAMAPLMIDDVAEASRHLENDVVVAWLVERGGSINLDARRLVLLADAGVPSSTIDVLVALAYPSAFAINSRRAQRELADYGVPLVPPPTYGACDFAFDYGSYCGGFDPYGYGFGGWYPGYPYVIVYTGSGGGGGGGGGGSGDGARSHGRVVNGKGYEEGQGSTADVSRHGEPRSATGGSASPGGSSSTSSSSSGEQRTAKPRP